MLLLRFALKDGQLWLGHQQALMVCMTLLLNLFHGILICKVFAPPKVNIMFCGGPQSSSKPIKCRDFPLWILV